MSTIDYKQSKFQFTEDKKDYLQESNIKSSAVKSIGMSDIKINENLSPHKESNTAAINLIN